ncbi:hypothetical protein G1C96_0222 [Bifidobacterium sp. DSM 109958]|uniref:DUF805 domain-containing protein n=1 Tax=Bifidobacterium moraviense TaxID=2675323 RepID=A0A7Y0F070_9BIFI|nr:DUF805 domain-containing protein [Bifidobacterium sp. DSM 109958]NMM99644.1 hypothetical protein [Bifidobacterium sp. DSM 109958]
MNNINPGNNVSHSGKPNPYTSYANSKLVKPDPVQGGEPGPDEPYYGVGFGRAVRRFWGKAFVWRGRASRGEYWWAALFCFLALFACDTAATAADVALFHVAGDGDGPIGSWTDLIVNLTLIVPLLAVSVRRLHDSNLSGWWVLLPAVFQIGYIAAMAVAMFAGGAAGTVMGLLTTALLVVAYLLSEVVLFILPPDPRGTRFDGPRAHR